MSQSQVFNNTTYSIPVQGDPAPWGPSLTRYLAALGTYTFSPAGGTRTLTADLNLGASFGLLAPYYKSVSANISATGVIRLAHGDAFGWRNNANSGDLMFGVNSSDQLLFNGAPFFSGALTNGHILVGSASNIATDVALSGDVAITNAGVSSVNNVQAGVITNAMVNNAAAIAYSKLSLSGSIVNSDINSSAAIAYSKLALTGSVKNSDLTSGAYSNITGVGTQAQALNMNAHQINSVSDGSASADAANVGQLTNAVGVSNILINGGAEFWQRGTSFSSPANASYCADRWQVAKDVTTFSFAQESTTIDGAGLYSIKMVVTTLGGGSTCKLIQQVENVQEYRGKTITFTARVNTNTNNCISLNVFDGSAHFSSYAVGNSTWQTLSVTLTVSSSATALQFQVGCVQSDAVACTAYFDNLMAVQGSIAVPFFPRPYAAELALCQRYYEKSYDLATAPGTNTATGVVMVSATQTNTTQVESSPVSFKVTKRITPTVTLYTPGGTSGQWTWTSTAAVDTNRSTIVDFLSTQAFNVVQTAALNFIGRGHWAADAEM